MPKRLVVLFNLKPGKTPADYEAWAKATDLPVVNALKSIDRFEVYRTTGLLGSDAKPPYEYIELIDVNDMDLFGDEVGTDTMKRVAAEFQGWADPVFIATEPVA